MKLRLFLIVIAFVAVALVGPIIGEKSAERKCIKIIKRQQELHEMEMSRQKKANEAYAEYIKMLEDKQ